MKNLYKKIINQKKIFEENYDKIFLKMEEKKKIWPSKQKT